MIEHPQVAWRDCGHCQEWLYNERTGKVETWRRGTIQYRRPKDVPPRCRTSMGCPKGTPEQQKSLSQRNLEAYHHYCECKSVANYPDDPIVRRNAMIIRTIEEAMERREREALRNMIVVAMRERFRG